MDDNTAITTIPRTEQWQRLRELWEQQVPAERLQPLLEHYIARVEAEDNRLSRALIVPLRWLALLHHMQQQRTEEIRVLGRTVSLMQAHLGKDHLQTVQALLLLIGCCDQGEERREHLPLVMHFLAQRRGQLDMMDLRLLQAFVMTLYEPRAGATIHNRNAFLLLQRYVDRHLAFDREPDMDLRHAVEILWYLAWEVGRYQQLVPTFRLLANVLANLPADEMPDPGQIARLRVFVDEAMRNLSAEERRKIHPQLRVVEGDAT